jgi:NitT/TauT family transport system ATP-binding protein
MNAMISFCNVSQSFQHAGRTVSVFENINLDVNEGEFTTLLGPSGCGKTTLMRMATGLLKPTSGDVLYNGKRLDGVNKEIGLVTQESKLFPWLTLLENVEFPLGIRRMGNRQQRRNKAAEWIERVGLGGYEDAYPSQLSGGMQKRASIVRSLIYEPTSILMDEPFGPLDAQTRAVLQDWLLDLWAQNQMTVLFVTHDLTEAAVLSDTAVVLGAKPARIRDIVPVDLPRPRDVFGIYNDPEFPPLYDRLSSHFRTDLLGDRGSSATDPKQVSGGSQ